MLILDADSLMTGDTIVRLVAAHGSSIRMSALIQTLPIVVNAENPVRATGSNSPGGYTAR